MLDLQTAAAVDPCGEQAVTRGMKLWPPNVAAAADEQRAKKRRQNPAAG